MTKTKTTKKAMTMIADDEMTTMTATAAASMGAEALTFGELMGRLNRP